MDGADQFFSAAPLLGKVVDERDRQQLRGAEALVIAREERDAVQIGVVHREEAEAAAVGVLSQQPSLPLLVAVREVRQLSILAARPHAPPLLSSPPPPPTADQSIGGSTITAAVVTQLIPIRAVVARGEIISLITAAAAVGVATRFAARLALLRPPLNSLPSASRG